MEFETLSAAEADHSGISLHVLLIENSEDDAELVTAELRRGGYAPVVLRVEDAAAMTAALVRREWDLIICDYSMPRFSGPAALELLHVTGLDLPFLIVSGHVGEDLAVQAMKAGAHDYLIKGKLARLVPAVSRALREAATRRERARAGAERGEEAQNSAALGRVAEALISSLDTPRLLDSLCRCTTEALQCDVSRTWLWQSKDDTYTVVSSHGDAPEERVETRSVRLPRAAMTDLVAAIEELGVVQVVMSEHPNEIIPGLAQSLGITVVLYLPLRRGKDLVGFQTAAYRGREQRFTRQQKRLAAGIAHIGSLALANALLIEELEQANRVKSDFVATMSHELRTPLNVIVGYVTLLRDGSFGRLTDEQIAILERVDRSSLELLDLIAATLDFSRIDKGQLPIEISEIALDTLLDQLRVECSFAGNVPAVDVTWQPPAETILLRTDVVKLKVILKNLVRNALKFTEQGRVLISTQRRGGGVEFVVSDTGIGISADLLPVVFEPFRQGDGSSTRRYGGVGLGLYIVRSLVDALGGTVAVESNLGRGSTFRVLIPQDISLGQETA